MRRELHIRPGDERDEQALLTMFDEAVEWLVARGSSGQWGCEPWSASPRTVARVRAIAVSGELWMAEVGGESAGALQLTETPPAYAGPIDEPERYVSALITSRRHTGRGVGSSLLEHARDLTTAAGITLLRVDCWAGGDGELVRYYERNGFTRTHSITVGEWHGQVLAQRLSQDP